MRNLDSYARVKHYVQTVDGIPGTNTIFCGLYRRDSIRQLMPFPGVVGGDHVLLVRLALIGEFSCLPTIHLQKYLGGLSRSINSQVGALQLRSRVWNQLNLICPYLCRQLFFHGAILCDNHVSIIDKSRLHIFLLLHYLSFIVRPYQRWVGRLRSDLYYIYKAASGDKNFTYRLNVLPDWLLKIPPK